MRFEDIPLYHPHHKYSQKFSDPTISTEFLFSDVSVSDIQYLSDIISDNILQYKVHGSQELKMGILKETKRDVKSTKPYFPHELETLDFSAQELFTNPGSGVFWYVDNPKRVSGSETYASLDLTSRFNSKDLLARIDYASPAQIQDIWDNLPEIDVSAGTIQKLREYDFISLSEHQSF